MTKVNEDTIETTRPINLTPYSNSELVDLKLSSQSFTKGRSGGAEGQNVITNITLHIVNGDWRDGGFVMFAQSNDKSANYGITSAGRIVQVVDEKNTPWTNGVKDGYILSNPFGSGTVGSSTNSVTIEISNLRVNDKTGPNTFVATDGKEYNFKVENGKTLIEMNGNYYERPVTNAALDATIRLVADIAKRNNLGELYHDGYNGTLTWHRDFSSGYVMCPGDYIMAMTDYICESANMINEKGYYIPDYAVEGSNALMGLVLETTENPFGEGTVASDMYLTVSSINNIRNAMGAPEVQTPTCTSTATIPGNLMNVETSLLGISSDLNSTIYNETKVISSIAQVFFDMDREREAAATALSDGSELNFDDSDYISQLNDLISTDITSELKFDSFMFDPFSHTEGNSGKLCLSDLNAMLSGGSLTGPLHENLENERQSANATKTEIDNLNAMISSGTNFKGEVWKAVSKRLTDYSDLMNLRMESADKLETAIAEAIKLIVDYMGNYEELDDSKLPELKENAEQVKQSIIDAQAIIDATHNVTRSKKDENGNITYYSVIEYTYSAGARSQAKDFINKASTLLKEIYLEINKLENLPIVLAKAEQIINDALTEIYGNYGVKASNAVTGKTVSYIPPQNTNYEAQSYTRIQTFNSVKQVEGKITQDRFYMIPALLAEYGSYEDYLNGVTKENNPLYNKDMVDKGIEPGETLDDKLFEESVVLENEDVTEVSNPEEQTSDNPDDTLDDSQSNTSNDSQSDTSNDSKPDTPNDSQPDTPSDSKPDTPSDSKPDTPSDSQPDTPSDSQPDTPSDSKPDTPSDSQPDTPSDSQPDTPSDSQPDTPSDSQPDTPSDSKPDTPSDSQPDTPNDSKPDTPSDSQPDTPSDPQPDTPSDSQPNTPSDPQSDTPNDSKPDTPSDPKPSTPSDPKPSVPSGSSKPENNPGTPNTGDNSSVDVPGESETPSVDVPPIVEIPDEPIIDEPIVDTPVVDDKPIIDITPNTGNDNNNSSSSNNEGIDLTKAIGVSLGVGAAVGAAALGAHTVKKAKDNNIYEDD